jgi:CheY-like chemotaxis protein
MVVLAPSVATVLVGTQLGVMTWGAGGKLLLMAVGIVEVAAMIGQAMQGSGGVAWLESECERDESVAGSGKATEEGTGSETAMQSPSDSDGKEGEGTNEEEPPEREVVGMAVAGVMLTGRVLVVEDSVETQKLLAFHLRKMGLQVDISSDGQDALDLLTGVKRDSYAMILTDMAMPRVDGIELVKTARELDWTVPIVALTASHDEALRRKSLAAGCDAYATKPIDAEELTRLCRLWVGIRRRVRMAA